MNYCEFKQCLIQQGFTVQSDEDTCVLTKNEKQVELFKITLFTNDALFGKRGEEWIKLS